VVSTLEGGICTSALMYQYRTEDAQLAQRRGAIPCDQGCVVGWHGLPLTLAEEVLDDAPALDELLDDAVELIITQWHPAVRLAR
jgi:hypothetical protein